MHLEFDRSATILYRHFPIVPPLLVRYIYKQEEKEV